MKQLGCGPVGRAEQSVARRIASITLSSAMAILGPLIPPSVDASGAGPSVRDIVEFTHVIQPVNGDGGELRSQVSPDGRRAFIVTRKGEVEADRNRYEIRLLDLDPERLAARRQAPARSIVTVFAAEDGDYADPAVRDVRWAGNGTLVFLARMDERPYQAYRVDVASGVIEPLTSGPGPVVSFSVSDDLRRIVYAVQVPNPPMAPGSRSVVVGNQSFWSVKFGQNDLRSQDRHFQYVTMQAGDAEPHALGQPFASRSGFDQSMNVSPDGRWVLLPRYERERQAEWAARYPLIGDLTRLLGAAGDDDPLAYYSRQTSYTTRTTVARRLSDGTEQLVVDAPDDAYPGIGQVRPDKLWLGGGTSVVIAGTFLPALAGQPLSTRSQVIEYWPDDDRWTVIAELAGRAGAVSRLRGESDAFAVLDGEQERRFERGSDGAWRELASEPRGVDASTVAQVSRMWTLHVQEGLNEPIDIVASSPDGGSVRLTDLNPGFSATTWGAMRPYAWTDRRGRRWDGGLLMANGSEGRRGRPLVIQTYGFSSKRFYLDGANQYDGYTSGFAGRAFLQDDVVVLAMPFMGITPSNGDERDRSDAFAEGVRSAIDALAAEGVIDRDRVGIMGWSATGEHVLNLLTFSKVPIRAATMLDGDANTLFSLAITYGAGDSIWKRKSRFNRGLPFGDGLANWVRDDPSLHTDCVTAALRIETYGPWVLNNWDIYALMRRQYKPAEMVVVPGGAHSLGQPSERMLSLQGNVDWFGFWLAGQERSLPFLAGETAATLGTQYARWREMAELKKADDARPRCRRPGTN